MGSFLSRFLDQSFPSQVLAILFTGFWVWMLVDAIRREEWIWAVCIFFFGPLSTLLYFFFVYRNAASLGTMRGFQLPGTNQRSRIKELEAQIHHLDKAHHHLKLGDIYFQQGKFPKALECYQRAHERDREDEDIRAHLGQCLLRLNRAAEARPLLESVCAQNPRHDYGHSMMALAETYAAIEERGKAIETWRRVLEENGYARARVQLAELYLQEGNSAAAKTELEGVLADDAHSPHFQRKRDAVWVKRTKRLLKNL